MKLIKDGKIVETPIYKEVEGITIELSLDQLIGLGYEVVDNILEEQKAYEGGSPIYVDKLSLFLESIKIKDQDGNILPEADGYVPEESLPIVPGYKWVPSFKDGAVVFTQVEDPNAYGTEEKPFLFDAGIRCIPNAYYLYDGVIYQYKGELKYTDTWEDVAEDMTTGGGGDGDFLKSVFKYNIAAPGEEALFYTRMSPAGATGTFSTFPEGSYAKIYDPNGDLENEISVYFPCEFDGNTSKNGFLFNYNFQKAGVYTVEIYSNGGNTNSIGQPGTSYDDNGCANFANFLRGDLNGNKVKALADIVELTFPENTSNIYSAFNTCTAKSCPDIILPSCLRFTDLFDSAQFETIGNVEFTGGFTTLTDAGEYGQGCKMFLNCANLKSVGNVIIGHCESTVEMFKLCGNLESIGVLDVLKDTTFTTNMFAGCTKLADVKIKSLPAAAVTLDLSMCPLNADSIDYMAANVDNGQSTVKFSAATKELANFSTVKDALEAKGYTVV